jgi:hypothetical protein
MYNLYHVLNHANLSAAPMRHKPRESWTNY